MGEPPRPFHNPFADALGHLRKPSDETTPHVAAPRPAVRPPSTVPRAVVRLERTGRGGKTVTVVDHLTLAPADRAVWLKALKAALGCGGVIEGEALVFQGDQRQRLPALLQARGVKKVGVAG